MCIMHVSVIVYVCVREHVRVYVHVYMSVIVYMSVHVNEHVYVCVPKFHSATCPPEVMVANKAVWVGDHCTSQK